MDRDVAAMASYQSMVAALRAAGIRAEIYLERGHEGADEIMLIAGPRPSLSFQGSNEREKGTAQVKDLILGATLSATKDREEYLALQAKAQFEVPVDGWFQAIKDVLARQGRLISSWPGLARPSTTSATECDQAMDTRPEGGHDESHERAAHAFPAALNAKD